LIIQEDAEYGKLPAYSDFCFRVVRVLRRFARMGRKALAEKVGGSRNTLSAALASTKLSSISAGVIHAKEVDA
jgi:hypothetical protein